MDESIYSFMRGINAFSVEDAMRQYLNSSRKDEITETTIADALCCQINRDKHIVRDVDGLYECELEGNALYVFVHDENLLNIIHNIELAPIDNGRMRFKGGKTKTNNIVKIVKDRIFEPGYFADAPIGVAAQNCFLRVDGNKIIAEPLTMDHRQREALSVAYNEDACTSMIDGFMCDTFQEPGLVDLVYEIIGVALFGRGGAMHKIIVLHGGGGNGKGVFTRLIKLMLPNGMYGTLSPKDMKQDYNRAQIYGKRVNVIGELPSFDREGLEWYKTFSGGDYVLIRFIGKDSFSYQPIALQVISTNKLPVIPDTIDNAIRRRMMVIPFNNTIQADKEVKELEKRLFAANGEGLLLRAVQGYQRVLDRGEKFAEPDAVRRATDAWLHPYEGVRLFAETCLEKVSDGNVRISADEMYERCCDFCHRHNLHVPTSKIDLSKKLTELGFQSKQSNTMHWIGVHFKD